MSYGYLRYQVVESVLQNFLPSFYTPLRTTESQLILLGTWSANHYGTDRLAWALLLFTRRYGRKDKEINV